MKSPLSSASGRSVLVRMQTAGNGWPTLVKKLLSSGREKRLASDHSVTVRGNEWYDHAEERGGHAVSFVQRFYGLSYPDVVTLLLGGEPGTAYPSAGERTEEPAKPFVLPPTNKDMRRVFAYLIKHRSIARDVVAHFAKAGLLYSLLIYGNNQNRHNGLPQKPICSHI